MKVFRLRYDTSGRPTWTRRLAATFGERNSGFLLAGETSESAYKEWTETQAEGERINRGYLIITEEVKR